MTIRVGINGFGRIGRMALRAVIQETEFNDIEVVAINSSYDIDYMMYMLKYDSVHGRFDAELEAENGHLLVNGKKIHLTAERDPANIDWSASGGVDVVVESTGAFLTVETCQPHINRGAKKVVQSAPGKDDTPMYVYGVNHDEYKGQAIVSAASCTTNGLAPLVKVLHDHFGIKRGLMTTVHATTASQLTVDGTSKKDWRGGRSVFENIIPSSTGAAKAVGKIIPALNKKITGMAMRVPSADVSVVDLTVELNRETTYEAICEAMKTASQGELKGVLGYTNDKVVSTDFRSSPEASVFDADAGIMLDSTFVKVIGWYDNEYGYTCNLLRLVQHISK
ncbi:MAG: type I glyceraldehyde-3-phosphate dehydrogenase [Methylophilus sp.]|nr:type I glyceraldehyde-3-phosphate dehydrogenase [Methylophilus sp.]MDP3609935.1 type I glyceraldehyde-3-phosphate dehydrogenase [Methylophilus sp.]